MSPLAACNGDERAPGQVDEQARNAAREFVARWSRETGEESSAVVADRMLLAYEMGYLHGHDEGMRGAERASMSGDRSASVTEQTSERARFAAREFVARWSREMGEELLMVVADRMLFAHEMGCLRGHGEGLRCFAVVFHDALKRKVNDADAEHE
jgi:hypothetical protein